MNESLDDPRDVEYAVDVPVRGDDLLGQRLDGSPVGDTERVRREPALRCLGQRHGLGETRLAQVDGSDATPSTNQLEHDLATDAVAAAGDDEDLVFDLHDHSRGQ